MLESNLTEQLTSLERVQYAIERKEFDRIPRDVGGLVSNISLIAYKKLLEHWNIQSDKLIISDRVQQLAEIDEHILKRLRIDTRHIRAIPPNNRNSSAESDSFIDPYGIKYQRIGIKEHPTLYYEMVEFPLAKASLADIHSHSWPKAEDNWFTGKSKQAKSFIENGFAVVANPLSGGILEQTIWLRGFDQFLRDIYSDRSTVIELLDQNLTNQISIWEAWLGEVGEWTTIALYGDDYGTQERLLLSPTMWRDLIKPRVKDLVQTLKRNFPEISFQLHSCGAVEPIIKDLIEIGFDILNPVQPRAKGMDHKLLKEKYGKKICFHGGFDIQEIMPKGTKKDVQTEAERLFNTLAKNNTGYIFAFAHNLLADTPPLNIVAVFNFLDEKSN